MESRYYDIAFNPELLTQQLYDAFPEWDYVEVAPGILADPFEIWHDTPGEAGFHLHVPDGTDWGRVEVVITAHNPASQTRREIQRNQIIAMAQATAGVRLVDLTQAQIKSLLAVMLYKAGGVNLATMTVRPLQEWV